MSNEKLQQVRNSSPHRLERVNARPDKDTTVLLSKLSPFVLGILAHKETTNLLILLQESLPKTLDAVGIEKLGKTGRRKRATACNRKQPAPHLEQPNIDISWIRRVIRWFGCGIGWTSVQKRIFQLSAEELSQLTEEVRELMLSFTFLFGNYIPIRQAQAKLVEAEVRIRIVRNKLIHIFVPR